MSKKLGRSDGSPTDAIPVTVATSPALKLPAELVCYAAHFLPYPCVCAAICVCRRWRKTLLADKGLWTKVSAILAERSSRSWVSRLEALFERASGCPISLDLVCDQFMDENRLEYGSLELERVAHLIGTHMSTIQDLMLSIPTCATAAWTLCLTQRAPMLRFFRIYNTSHVDRRPCLPLDLFGGHAPLLDVVCLEQAYFPYDILDTPERMAALDNVVALYFHTMFSLENEDLFDVLNVALPSLALLTCTVNVTYDIERIPYQHDFILRLNAAPGVSDVIACFRNAAPVVYSFTYTREGREGDLDTVGMALRAQQPVTSVAIAWTPEPRGHASWLRTPAKEPEYHTIDINGRPLIVDLHIDSLRTALTPDVVELLTAHVRTLTVVDTLWPVFAPIDMSALEELTISLRASPDWGDDHSIFGRGVSSAEARRTLRALRLARASGRQHVDDFAIPAASIATFVRNTLSPDCLPTLHLNGVVAMGEGTGDLAGAVARIVQEVYVPPDEPDPWCCDLQSEDALLC